MKMLFSVALASLFMGCTSEPLIVHTYEVTFVLAGSKEDTKEYNSHDTPIFVLNKNYRPFVVVSSLP